ncbi:hypothetical protein MTR_2g059820 [Medicago truncatula]|uniref:Uncharacterized protein n=1 Tax=Medicago truncatula TaxID=3880 RepID=A0A072V888_MEDTR|nr:hypothetical protein MTR_2g059820 [Medicago truncatula]
MGDSWEVLCCTLLPKFRNSAVKRAWARVVLGWMGDLLGSPCVAPLFAKISCSFC